MTESKKKSFKDAAAQILKEVGEPLSYQEIAKRAIEKGILSTEGKTPEASMGAQIYMDIKKNKKSPFKKVGRGMFALKVQKDSATTPLLLIENQNQLVRKALKAELHKMDPFQFEALISELLKKIGYENVEVTSRSGDKGIDVTADLTLEGITDVKTVVQVKRFKEGNNIPGKIITQLRGSAEVDQRGLVITTSDFTKDAIEESKAPNKMPVSLVNGEKLLSLLIKNGIGVKREDVTIYSLDTEFFTNETSSDTIVRPSNKGRAMYPLPGGINSYMDALNNYLNAINTKKYSKEKFIDWQLKEYENVNSRNSAVSYLNLLRNIGVVNIVDNDVCLTQEGKEYIAGFDKNVLYNIISNHIQGFSEIVEFLEGSDEPQTEQDITEYLKENLGLDWETHFQVTLRLLWLVNLGKIIKTEDGYITKN
ncbi:restriction endonuclease [Fibrobacterota bacterium]